MAGNGTVSISFVLKDETNGLKTLTLGVTDLRKVLSSTVAEAEKLNKPFISFASLATGIDSVSRTLTSLQSVLKATTDCYATQIEAETQLATNMRNTMAACDSDIKSIKDLCAAQQELGVIGDEVQLSGAQELATYLSEKQSLEKLIPVMNDMLAQQYGLNASQENASQIATMLGKVMDGQTGALSRYGYSFDEIQESILKYGTEAQRVAVLCEVVEGSVGGMNAELAKTDVGKQKQLENALGDIREQIGSIAQGAMPFVTMASDTTIALLGIVKLSKGVLAFSGVLSGSVNKINAFWSASNVITSSSRGIAKTIGTARLFISQFCIALTQGTHGLRLFAIAWKGMLISTGIGLAIAAVTSVIAYFALKADEATDSTNKLLDAQEAAKREAEQLAQMQEAENSTLERYRASLELNISRLKTFNGTKEQEAKLVSEMNNAYGDTMGYFSSVSDWYKALEANSKAYCRQMVIEARTRILADRIAKKEQESHDIAYDENGKKRLYSTKREMVMKNALLMNEESRNKHMRDDEIYDGRDILKKSDHDKAQDAINNNAKTVAALNKQLEDSLKEAASIKYEVTGSSVRPTEFKEHNKPDSKVKSKAPEYDPNAHNLDGYEKNIQALNHELRTASEERAAEINKEIALWQERADVIRNAGTAPVYKEEAANLKEIGENIRYLNEQLETASKEDATGINQRLEEWEKKAQSYRDAGRTKKEANQPVFNADATSIKDITENIAFLNKELDKTESRDEAARLNSEIDAWNRKADAMRNAGREAKVTFETYREGWGAIKGIGGGIEGITGALEGNGNAWQKITAIIDGFLQIYDGIRGVVDIINMMTGATEMQSAAEGVQAGTTVAKTVATQADTQALETNTLAAMKNTAAKQGESISEVVSQGAKLPFPANIAAIAAGVAAVVSALAVIGSFATGGIVGGNSPSGDKLLARVNSGEMILNKTQQLRLYNALNGNGNLGRGITMSRNISRADAKLDLNRLRGMLHPAGQPVTVRGTLRASGRDLVCVLANETRLSGKSGRRTDIRL